MKKYWFSMMLMALFAIGFSASEDEFVDDGSGGSIPVSVIGKVTANIDKWDAAYVTDKGYFCYNDNVGTENEDKSELSTLAFKSLDGSTVATLIATKDGNIPTQLVTKDGTYYFSYAENSVMELVFDDGKNVTKLCSKEMTKDDFPSQKGTYDGDSFKQMVANLVFVMDESASDLAELRTTFETVLGYTNDTTGKAASKLAKDSNGNYKFIADIYPWVDSEEGDLIFNSFNIWSAETSFKVGGSSCTLSGTIWSPSNVFNELGTCGIVCDEDDAKLIVGKAEYQEGGFQDKKDISFSVDFRGLKPNTTYYYRAYYKFKGSDHGSLLPKHGEKDANVIYDTVIKEFTTGDNVLSVDVVMCIDVTGSMMGVINTVKKNAISFFDSFKSSCDKNGIILSELSAQVISFRDKNVDEEWLTSSSTFSLPSQKSEFNDYVSELYADGGGDTPESGLEALDLAFQKADWGEDDGFHRQVIILWTDAPYLVDSYSSLTEDDLEAKWNTLPSGRRLVLFAPTENYDDNGGNWNELDGWKNLIHVEDLYSGFNNFDYILESIIGELTSKAKAKAKANVGVSNFVKTPFLRPNN